MKKNVAKHGGAEIFSLGVGGVLNHFFALFGLSNKPFLHKWRIIAVAFLVWFPLLVLAMLGGTAFGGVQLPFIHDMDVHVRFLAVLSMLIYAEIIAHDRIHIIADQFLKCNIIGAEDRPAFHRIIASATRLTQSVIAEVVIIVLVYTLGHWISTKYLPLGVTNWFAVTNSDIVKLTPAGYWYIFVSLPIFQFILLRWYFRIAIWYRFLWQISRLPLQLNSLHPDRAGGLGFLTYSIYAFGMFLLAHSVLLSGMIFNRIWNAGAVIYDFQVEIFSVLICLLIIPLVPLLFFIFQMIKEKRMGTLNYDVVANRYVNDFRQKWITPVSKNNASLLGTPDIQSLADLFNSFEVTNKMRITPFSRNSVVVLFILTALPLLPLILTIVPIDKMIAQFLGLIF